MKILFAEGRMFFFSVGVAKVSLPGKVRTTGPIVDCEYRVKFDDLNIGAAIVVYQHGCRVLLLLAKLLKKIISLH